MTLQIIETLDYILAVSDDEIKEGSYMLSHYKTLCKAGNSTLVNMTSIEGTKCKKVIAYQPKNNAKELDLPFLPEIVVEDDVEKFDKIITEESEYWYKATGSLTSCEIVKRAFSMGLKAATKVYSEEDLRKAFDFGTNEGYNYRDSEAIDEEPEELSEEDWNSFVKNLNTPITPKWFVAEKVQKSNNGSIPVCQEWEYELKTTAINGKTYLVGHYE